MLQGTSYCIPIVLVVGIYCGHSRRVIPPVGRSVAVLIYEFSYGCFACWLTGRLANPDTPNIIKQVNRLNREERLREFHAVCWSKWRSLERQTTTVTTARIYNVREGRCLFLVIDRT